MLKNILAVALVLMFSAKPTKAQAAPAPADPQIQYVGGITICADNPKALAAWYTDKFGLKIDQEFNGIYYGSVKYKDMDLNFGIHPASGDCQRSAKGFTVTFHVDNYAKYVDKLKTNGIVPFNTSDSGQFGKFAEYLDLENNKITVWGN